MNKLKKRLQAIYAADKKKCAVLGALLLLLGVFSIRTFIGGPRAAPAATDDSVGLSSPVDAGREAVSKLITSERVQLANIIEVADPPLIQRDLFALDPEHFAPPAQPSQPEEQAGPAPSPPVATGATVESPTQNADEIAAQQRAQLVAETAGWAVRSIVLGQNPLAVVEPSISGDKSAPRSMVLSPGQSIRGWALVEIGISSVVLEKQGVRVRLSSLKHGRP